jgi:type II secretion system protein G
LLKQLWAILNRPKANRGFTLIELLVVVAIIGLLAAFAVPKLFEAINKAKKSPGQADLQTISSALERYYMDKSEYPKSGTVIADLKSGYLKPATTFYNGFNKGYIYVTDAAGAYYVLIDAENEALATSLTLTCNTKTQLVTVGDKALKVYTSASIGPDDVKAGCTVSGATAPNVVTVVTN